MDALQCNPGYLRSQFGCERDTMNGVRKLAGAFGSNQYSTAFVENLLRPSASGRHDRNSACHRFYAGY